MGRQIVVATMCGAALLVLPSPLRAERRVAGPRAESHARAEQVQPETPRASVQMAAPDTPGARPGGTGGGALRPVRQVGSLISLADTILRGTVESVEPLGSGLLTITRDQTGLAMPLEFRSDGDGATAAPDVLPAIVYRLAFRVTATVKGTPAPVGADVAVQAYVSRSGAAWQVPEVGQHGLLLLSRSGDVAELHYPLLPIYPQAPVLPSTLSPKDAVGWYFLLSLHPDAPAAALESCLEGALELGVADEAIGSLQTLAASDDPAVEGVGLWGLVKLGDPGAVPAAVAFLLANPTVPGLPAVQAHLRTAISQLSDPAAAQDVLPLLSAAEWWLRNAAIDALRRTRGPGAVGVLVSVFDDPEPYIQWSAMMAVCDIAGIESSDALGPLEEFAANRDSYRAWWTNWWDQEGKAKYGTPAS